MHMLAFSNVRDGASVERANGGLTRFLDPVRMVWTKEELHKHGERAD